MKKIRIISAVLAILLAFSAVALPVFAASIDEYPSTEYESMAEKLSTMTLMYESEEYGYAMYFDTQSGEFALKNLKTGELTFSNPYDVATNSESSATGSDANADPIRHALLSQIVIEYSDKSAENPTPTLMLSYTKAALAGGQIQFKNIEDGVRVEYALGDVETKRLIPVWIDAERFETQILSILDARKNDFTSDEIQTYNGIRTGTSIYKPVGPASDGAVYDPKSVAVAEDPNTFRYLVENPGKTIYVLATNSARTKKNIENLIRKYVPDYTFDKLEEDHEITGYEGNEKELPLFRLAVEYTIDKDGLTASIPAKSIRYNETNYTLENIYLLPYFGCTTLKSMGAETVEGGKYTKNGGYIFIPDGSGTLLTYYKADGTPKTGAQAQVLYGSDYALENLDGDRIIANAEVWRLPVFGLTETSVVSTSVSRGDYRPVLGNKTVTQDYARGFFAIIEEGDSFATISAQLRQMPFGGGDTEYSTVYAKFSVKQSDTVTVGASRGDNKTLSATNPAKYTGNYTVRYILLSDPTMSEAKGIEYYDPSYIGMAEAYRDQLIAQGALDELQTGEVESNLPLYIHSFGALDTEDTILSFPVTVEKPLTTFADVMTMADQLKGDGITNVNFILEGFANGNMTTPYYPSYLKWNKTVGGKDGFEELLTYAKVNGIGLYPEFDFTTVSRVKAFSGFSYRKHAAQSMSGVYTTRRDYDPVYQVISKFGVRNIVSTGVYLELFGKFAKDYNEYQVGAIASLALGSDLNSDFNEDYPISREDSKQNVQALLAEMKATQGNVLIQGGNAYALPSASDVVDIPLDNSNNQISSYSVPFMGIVLHGYMNYAGGVINTEGDIKYEVMKSLENGAALYFLLSYQNTSEIKSAMQMNLNKNYSVAYTTWYNEVVEQYKTLNGAIGNLQTAQITGHEFVTAFRLEGAEAEFMFAQSNITRKQLADAEALYIKTRDEVDLLRKNNMVTDAEEKLVEEVEYRNVFNLISERQTLEAAFTEKYATGGVVAVTYTDDSGKDTTFFINYNSYDVAVQYEGGVFMIGAVDFINANDIETAKLGNIEYEAITSKQPTAGQLEMYETAKANYEVALASGNQTKINRALTALNKALSNMTSSTSHVVKLTNAKGEIAYFNYTNQNALVPLTETDYFVIPAQSTYWN